MNPDVSIGLLNTSSANASKQYISETSIKGAGARSVDHSKTEASLMHEAVEDYTRKKDRYMSKIRVYSDDKITSVDPATEVRTGLVASLLGNSKEAQDIQSKFRKMVEVPQEDFNLESFKILSSEVRNKLTKPNRIYSDQIKINPKKVKMLTQIEDFVTIQPTLTTDDYSN